MDLILEKVKKEVDRVDKMIGRPYSSYHEFYGVLLEELDELWREIKKKNPDKDRIELESIQIISVIYRLLNQKL